MRRCCCCVSVHAGSVLLGLLGVILAGLELAVLVPYLVDVDVRDFNPIKANLHDFFYILGKTIQDATNASKDVLGEAFSEFDHSEVRQHESLRY